MEVEEEAHPVVEAMIETVEEAETMIQETTEAPGGTEDQADNQEGPAVLAVVMMIRAAEAVRMEVQKVLSDRTSWRERRREKMPSRLCCGRWPSWRTLKHKLKRQL